MLLHDQVEDMHASSVAEIHLRGGASMRHLRSVYMRRMTVTPSVYYSDVGVLNYRNVSCIAGAADTVAIELFVYGFFPM